MLIPTRCPVCDALGAAPCARCASELRHAPALPPPVGLDSLRALLRYEDGGRELIARLKYRNARATLAWLAFHLAGLVPTGLLGAAGVVTWVPTTKARRRARGYDQAELLARGVARLLAMPCRGLLVHGPSPPQTGRSAGDRLRGPPLLLRRGATTVPPVVFVVDDVVTSGATMRAAAAVLRAGGARQVHGLAAGRTPLRARARAPAGAP